MYGRVLNIGSPVNVGHPLNRGLVAWWMGLPNNSGGSRLFDLTNNILNHGTLTNGPTWRMRPGGFGAMSYAGASSQYVGVTSNSSISTGDTDFTIAAWAMVGTAGTRCVVGKGDGVGASTDEFLLRTVGGIWRWSVSKQTAYTDLSSTSGAVTANVWYFVVAWHDSTANLIGISVNGGPADTVAHSVGPNATSKGFALGRYGELSAQYWDGQLGEAMMWKRVLGADERKFLYMESLSKYPNMLRRLSTKTWSFGASVTTGNRRRRVLITAGGR